MIGVYQENLVVDAGGADRTVYVLNGANTDSITLNLQCAPARIEVYDTFGTRVDSPACQAGLQRLAVPVSGYARISWWATANKDVALSTIPGGHIGGGISADMVSYRPL